MASFDSAPPSVSVTVGIEPAVLSSLYGVHDRTFMFFEQLHPRTEIFARSNEITIKGEQSDVDLAAQHLQRIIELLKSSKQLDEETLKATLPQSSFTSVRTENTSASEILSVRGKSIRPQTKGQRNYSQAIDENTITFGIGPAGTGKTFLAVAKAVVALKSRQVSKIILTRPAVEAGEHLGYLPGSLSEKIDPYLRPLFDAAASMLDSETVNQLLASGAIEVAPLAYMRGRTLNESFIILDEAQNATSEQLKMFLTRLGYDSKMVITGDLTQADLPGRRSGLKQVIEVLKDIDDIAFQFLSSDDIVRHSLVGQIVDAYDKFDGKEVL